MQIAVAGFGNISYDERNTLQPSPIYRFAAGMSQVTRTFTCNWADRMGLVQGLLGYPVIRNGNFRGLSLPYISRYLPDAIPDFLVPGKKDPWLYASQVVNLVGRGPTGSYDTFGMAEYQEAEVTFLYEPRTYKIVDDATIVDPQSGFPDESLLGRYVTRVQKPAAEFVQLPRGTMAWVDGVRDKSGNPTRVDFASARLLPSTEITYTWHEVPFVPDAAAQFVGCLNRYDFTDYLSLDENGNPVVYPAGTLLLLAAEMKPYRTAAGVFVQDVAYRIKYLDPETPTVKGRGHNFFLRYYKNSNQLIRTKITNNGLNDVVAIPPDGTNNSPYNAATVVVAPSIKPALNAGTAQAVYGYAGFASLFKFHIQTADIVVGR